MVKLFKRKLTSEEFPRFNFKFKILFLVILILFSLLLTGCNEPEKEYNSVLEQRVHERTKDLNLKTKEDSFRSSELPKEMFVKLPDFPKDFYGVYNKVSKGSITNLCDIESKYWLQPEWFPNFKTVGEDMLQNPPENRYGAYGYSVYPGQVGAVILPNEKLEACFFVTSGFTVETYQALGFQVKFPESSNLSEGFSFPDGSNNVQQKDIDKFFDVQIEPRAVLIEPNYPIYSSNATKKVKVTIKAKDNIPSGNYVVSVYSNKIPEDLEREFAKNPNYVGTGMSSIGKAFYEIFIQVP